MLNAEQYGWFSRLLHRMVLSGDSLNEALFDLERGQLRPEDTVLSGRHVFIAGLARSGTTILLEQLYQTGEFCSLTYRDMPFVMAPNLWAKVSSGFKRQMTATHRAHNDGLSVDYDSPEALEEVFWRVHAGADYLREDHLLPMEADSRVQSRFRDYVALILQRYGRQRYLSKNNNNILRLTSIQAAFPNAFILVPFRQPLQHAASLLRQHQQFLERHQQDRFGRDYMTWLVHHEFGMDHRRFLASGSDMGLEPSTLNYWLQLWTDVYRRLFAEAKTWQLGLFCYERFCEQPQRVWPWLMEQAQLKMERPAIRLQTGHHDVTEPLRQDLVQPALQLYEEMRDDFDQKLQS